MASIAEVLTQIDLKIVDTVVAFKIIDSPATGYCRRKNVMITQDGRKSFSRQ